MLVNRLKKQIDGLKKSIQADADDSLNNEKVDFIDLERRWKEIEEELKVEDEGILEKCKASMEQLSLNMEPVRNVLL